MSAPTAAAAQPDAAAGGGGNGDGAAAVLAADAQPTDEAGLTALLARLAATQRSSVAAGAAGAAPLDWRARMAAMAEASHQARSGSPMADYVALRTREDDLGRTGPLPPLRSITLRGIAGRTGETIDLTKHGRPRYPAAFTNVRAISDIASLYPLLLRPNVGREHGRKGAVPILIRAERLQADASDCIEAYLHATCDPEHHAMLRVEMDARRAVMDWQACIF